jgi:hypothetical protein
MQMATGKDDTQIPTRKVGTPNHKKDNTGIAKRKDDMQMPARLDKPEDFLYTLSIMSFK